MVSKNKVFDKLICKNRIIESSFDYFIDIGGKI